MTMTRGARGPVEGIGGRDGSAKVRRDGRRDSNTHRTRASGRSGIRHWIPFEIGESPFCPCRWILRVVCRFPTIVVGDVAAGDRSAERLGKWGRHAHTLHGHWMVREQWVGVQGRIVLI
jgi:hypothetical protein